MIDGRGLYEYIDKEPSGHNSFRAAVFHNFRNSPEYRGYGVYVLDGKSTRVGGDWTLFGDLVDSREKAVHLMIAYAQLGAFDVYI